MTGYVVVIGDAMLDVDVHALAERLTPDAPVPVLDEVSRHDRPGGAALAALLAARDQRRRVVLMAPLPDDAGARRLLELLAGRVEVVPLACSGATPVKTRLRARGSTVARLDQGTGLLTLGVLSAEAVRTLSEATAVLVSDYGGGVTTDEPVRALLAACAAVMPVVWDPHPRGGPPVPGVTLVTPNGAEALAATGIAGQGPAAVRRRADELLQRWGARAVAVTLGSRGALLSLSSGGSSLVPARTSVHGDTCGAGDCFAAAALMSLAAGDLPSEAVAAAVTAATAFVARGAASGLDLPEEDDLAVVEDSAAQVVEAVRARGGTVVATGGCFDLLHAGHVETLVAARSLGDCLVVCLNSDESVRRLKGEGRPLQPAADRAAILAALRCVDAVTIFDEDTPAEALRALRPDIWVKGGDYAGARLPEASVLEEWGGEVVTVPYLRGRSTSELMDLARR